MIAPKQFTRQEAQDALPTWRLLLGRLHLGVSFGDFAAAMEFVNRVAQVAEELYHHPEIDVRYSWVHLALSSHDVGGITERDIEVARRIDGLIADSGGVLEPGRLSETEIAIDTMDEERIRPFWSAVLGYPTDGDEDLTDPDAIGPTVWFQQLDEPRPVRNRIHLDVTVAHDEAEQRISRALAAGGHLVSDSRAPAWWILADADGNEVCICTWQERDEAHATSADSPRQVELGS